MVRTKNPQVFCLVLASVAKSLCKNTEIIKLINRLGHGISYSLIEEIKTEYALKLINEQNHNRVIVPTEFQNVADNIDNLENTLTGTGASHRVNSIPVRNKQSGDTTDVQVDVKICQANESANSLFLQILMQKKSLSTFPAKGLDQENSLLFRGFRTLPTHFLMMISRQPRDSCIL